MRIVSLSPAGTEWIYVLDMQQALVGRSHLCDYPAAVQHVPALTGSQQGSNVVEIDSAKLRALEPDLILIRPEWFDHASIQTQDWTGKVPHILLIKPMTLKQVLSTGLEIGRLVGKQREAMQRIMDGERQIGRLRNTLGLPVKGYAEGMVPPTVACIESFQPLTLAGRWIPDLIEQAGGLAVLSKSGRPSKTITLDLLTNADPDIIIFMPCDGSRIDPEQAEWLQLRVMQNSRIILWDHKPYANRPGPRVYEAVERLAEVLKQDG